MEWLYVALMVALSAFSTWMPYRAWRKGVIRIYSTTTRRSKEPKWFMVDLVLTGAFAAICWIGTALMICRQLSSH